MEVDVWILPAIPPEISGGDLPSRRDSVRRQQRRWE